MTGTWPASWATGDVVLAAEFKKGIGAIADTTLGGSAANIDMTSISATYAHLMLVIYARCDAVSAGAFGNLQFNGDTAANYDSQRLNAAAAGPAVAAELFAQTSTLYGAMPSSTSGANLFSANIVFIPHYAGTANNKVALSVTSIKLGTSTGNLVNYIIGGFWRSNAAINRINLIPATGNFVAGTRVTLYGLGA